MIQKLKVEFENYLKDHAIKQEPQSLYDPINYIMSTGGKRFRPLLCLLLASNNDESISQEAFLTALTIELFHNFTLVHDDIMDEADVRRGSPAVHKKYSVPKAILSGDAMLILCFDMLTQIKSEHKDLLLKEFINAAMDVCKGQELDLVFETTDDVSYEEYIEMVRLKTGVLIGLSLFTGGLLSGLNYEDAMTLKKAGEQIGIAFQVKDDYLDVYGNSSDTGKMQGGDILNGKKTLLYYYAINEASAKDRERIAEIYQEKAVRSPKTILEIKEIYDKYNIPKLLEEEMLLYNRRSNELIHSVQLNNLVEKNLRKLLPMLINRNG